MPDSDEHELDPEGVPTDGGSVLAPERQPVEPDVDEEFEPEEFEPEAGPAGPSWLERAGRRIVRRPVEWATRPWPTERVVRVALTAFTLIVTTVIVMNIVHFNPLNAKADLIFDDNTPTGGDMGAHVWGPAFLRDHLLPHFQLNGWSMDWYAGMPAYRFYMVVPALAMVALDTVLPYGVAFKLVAIAGLVSLPFACWAFGRLARFRFPMPELFAFAGMLFALDESFSIYGGNVKSTMAGEFSFSIALTFMILGLGFLANGMQTGKYRSWAAILLALAVVCHGIVAIYVLVLAAPVFVLVHLDSVKRLWFGLSVGGLVLLLSAWWLGPFISGHDYMTDMKYGARPEGAGDSYWDMFFPLTSPLDILVTTLAVIGFAACIARRHANGTALGVIGLLGVAAVYAIQEDGLPFIGLLWNPRLLPLIYFVRYLLMMVGIVEVASLLIAVVRNRPAQSLNGFVSGSVTFGVAAVAVLLVLGFMFEVLPGGGRRVFHDPEKPVYAWGPFRKTANAGDAQGDGWTRYNFAGYEGRTQYPEYYDVVNTMADLGRTNGCGRALWENNEDNGQYGTTMALMLLPFWTDGCIASMEGLFFEASGTTPYHFLATAAMSKQSSNPVRELRYVDNDASVGVPELQSLGVRYTMVRTNEAKREAQKQPDLTLVATSGPWEIYQVADSDIVVPLDTQPVVVEQRSGDQRERNLELGTSWFQHPDEWAAIPADGGPDNWQRITVGVDETRAVPDPNRPLDNPDTRSKQVDIVVPQEQIDPVRLPRVQVTDVQMGEQDVSFHVDRVGVPVLVRVSYFPNWEAEGADGPYRIAPNFMVVVPTENDVRLYYGRSSSDLFFYALTLIGIGLLVFFRIRGDAKFDAAGEAAGAAAVPRGQPATDETFSFPSTGYRDGDDEFDAPPPSGLPVTEPPHDRAPVDAESAQPPRAPPVA
jgi:hypothetical protein